MSQKEDSAEKPDTIATYKIIIVVAIIGAIAMYFLYSAQTADSFMINSFTFNEISCPDAQATCYQTLVQTNIGARQVTFYSDPREIREIQVQQGAVLTVLNLTTSRDSSLTIAFDEGVPGSVGVAGAQLARITGERLYNISTSAAVYGQQVTCEQSQGLDRVVYLVQGERNGAFIENGCILLVAENPERLREVVDAYTMHLLLILP